MASALPVSEYPDEIAFEELQGKLADLGILAADEVFSAIELSRLDTGTAKKVLDATAVQVSCLAKHVSSGCFHLCILHFYLQLSSALAALGHSPVPVCPGVWSVDSLRSFCLSVGYAYSTWSAFLGTDFLASELQAAQMTLAEAAATRKASDYEKPLSISTLLAAEVQALSRTVGLPRVSMERLVRTPEAVLAQVSTALRAFFFLLLAGCLNPRAFLVLLLLSQIQSKLASLISRLPRTALDPQVSMPRSVHFV